MKGRGRPAEEPGVIVAHAAGLMGLSYVLTPQGWS